VRVLRHDVNVGIVQGLSLCLQHVTGEYVIPMDADDLLTRDALHVLAAEIRSHRPDLIYSDEDTYRDGAVASPFFRPDFDPVLNAESSYVWHLCAFRREAALRLGVYSDTGAEYCHDWDTISRFAAAGGTIAHAPHVLYHWRAHSGSQSNSGGQNPGSLGSTKHMLTRTIAALSNPALYEIAPFPIFRGAEEWFIRRLPLDAPRVAAVCLGKSARKGVAALFERCGFPLRVVHDQEPEPGSRWTAVLHQALREGAEYVLVVSSDGKDLDQSGVWEAVKLLELHQEVGIVSGRLLNADDVVIDCGTVADSFGRLVSPFTGLAKTDAGPFAMALKAHCVLCPTEGLFVARATFLARALERQPPTLNPSQLSAWLGACAVADGVRIAYAPLFQARTRGEVAAVPDEAGRTFGIFVDQLGVPGFDARSKVLGIARFIEARRFMDDSGTSGPPTPAPSTPGERLQPVSS
jgi:hypothetical protein